MTEMIGEEKNKKKKIIIIVAAALVLVAALLVFLYFRSQIRATTMRILRIEGEVTLEENAKKKSVRENLRLNSGDALSTALNSLVSIGLDDTKIVTLVQNSRAIFEQKGRELDLQLTDGSLFFEVQKALEDDERMDIKTSTMIVGIRGTSGWVSVEGDHETLIVTSGHVHVIGINPVTGERKEIDVYAGQRLKTYLYNDRDVDSIMFYVEDITEHDLPEELLEILREDPVLREKVCTETGWDEPWIMGIQEKSLTPVPETSPETKEPDKNKDGDSGDEESLTTTPTPTPTPTGPGKQNEDEISEEELEKMLAELLAQLTPTPTPTPWWLYPQEKTEVAEEEPEEDDDDDDKGESTPTPTPTRHRQQQSRHMRLR